MEELKPEELEELVQELEGESEEEEALSPEVEDPDLMWRARSAAEQAAIQREEERLREYQELREQRQREKQRAIAVREARSRKATKVGLLEAGTIAFGILWVGAIASVFAAGIRAAPRGTELLWTFGLSGLLALPGIAVLALGLWTWRAATINREALLRSMKETVGTVEDLCLSSGGGEQSITTCHVTVRFEAEDAKMGTRVIALDAQVAHRLWKGLRSGESVGIRYAAEDPRIALIEGEW